MQLSGAGAGRLPMHAWEGYSLAERDRRWRAAREHAARAGFDALLVPLGNVPDARYLTEWTRAVMLLPTDERAPIVVAEPGVSNAWVPAPRPAEQDWITPTSEALRELRFERARIGVVGLTGGRLSHGRAHDGVANHRFCAELARQLPNATFADGTDCVGLARYVKSEEEIACLRTATRIAEAGVEEMIAVARPGLDESALYGRVMARMLALGSEYYPLALTTRPVDADREGRRFTSPPLGRRLETGTLIGNEVSAVWGGQIAQEDQPIVIGPVPDGWHAAMALQQEVFAAGLGHMRPGTSFGEFIDFIATFERDDGPSASILLHGRGLGDDGPLLVPGFRGDNIRDVPMQAGNAWVWKPMVHTADRRATLIWGGDVVVTERGGERLFTRPHGIVAIT